ncbi:MAG: alpha/beta fold hydrolase, partial [Rhodoplanes sp.]
MPKKRIVATGIESTHMVGTSKRGSGKKVGASRKGKPVSGRKTSRPAVRVTKNARAGKARRAAKKTAAKKPSRVTAAAAKKGAGGHPSARKKGAPRTLSMVKGKAQAGIAKRKSASAPKAGRAQAKTAKPIAPKAAPALPSHARKRAGPAQRAVRRTMGVVGAATAPTRPSTPATGDNEAETGKADELPAQAAEGMLGPNPFIGLRPQDIASTIQAIGQHAVMSPMLVLEHEAGLARDLIAILSGHGAIAPSPGDRRFTDTAWKDNPFYRMYLQGYLAWSTVLNRFVDKSGMDGTTRERARFVVSLLTDALAPTNTLLGNPTALKRAIDSGGSSLLEGLSHLLTDLSSNQGMPAQVDKKAFQVGENLAISPGAVVFRNDVLELIQYAPATPEIYARPQLIVPPQINKFYIFDLAPGKSLVEYLVKNAFQVFVVSWRNPTQAQRDWGIDTYVEALLEAIAALRDITGAEDVNLHGACSGAMTMAALLGYLAAKGQKLVNAATLMVA